MFGDDAEAERESVYDVNRSSESIVNKDVEGGRTVVAGSEAV
jgi:hypothetical protein